MVLTPATFRILEDVLGSEKLPAFIVWFGKCSETITFDLRFDDDDAYKEFRALVKTGVFYTTHTSSEYFEFYWGTSGDAFYSGQNDQDQLTQYKGIITKTDIRKDVKGGFWRGTATFVIGIVISL